MKRYLWLLFAALAPFVAAAADLKVIVNSSVGVSSISTDELNSVFLITKTSLSDGSYVEPVLVKGGPTHEAFLKETLSKTDTALRQNTRSEVGK